MPAQLASARDRRATEMAPLELETLLRVAPGIDRVDIELRVENSAEDHRLRMLFPVGSCVERFEAATTFDVAERTPGPCTDSGWIQTAPATFPHQGFVHAGGLTVVAPGLPEAEVTREDPARIAITLLRCIGSLSRPDLKSRPGPAGPGTDTPGAQCPGSLEARLSLLAGLDPLAAREAELGLRATACGEQTLVPTDLALVELKPTQLLLSAFKPSENGDGAVLRVLNPTAVAHEAVLTLGFPFERAEALRLDEVPSDTRIERSDATLRFSVPPRALRTLRIG
jgi:alpha-mannosidase